MTAPGRNGQIDLAFARVAGSGTPTGPGTRTALRCYAHRAPLQLGRILYPDESCPDMAYAHVAMIAGGLVEGDCLMQRVEVDAGARAHVTTLSATKVYRATGGHVAQRIELRAAAGGVLEWWPEPVIAFRGARFQQAVELQAHSEAVLLYGDLLLPGRTGERHDYAAYSSRVTACSGDGALLFVDTQALAPTPFGRRALRDTLPADRQVIGTVFVLARAAGTDLLAALRAELGAVEGTLPVLAGCSLLPGEAGVVVRLLAADGNAGRAALAAIRRVTRRELLHAGTAAPRKL